MMPERTHPKFYRTIPVTVQEDDGSCKDYLCLANEKGLIYSKSEVDELLVQIKDFYALDDDNFGEVVKNFNKLTRLEEEVLWSGDSLLKQNENGKYLIPQARYRHKKFNHEKRCWSFRCNRCGRKVSSKADKKYFTINDDFFRIYSLRTCSEDCAELFWKEKVKEWIKDRGYENFFEC